MAKRLYAHWDRLGNISAGINHLQHIKSQVTKLMHANYQGSTHKKADTKSLVWHLADHIQELQLQEVVQGHAQNQVSITIKAVPDLHSIGRTKFASSSLATFNKKIRDMISGNPLQNEEDDLMSVNFGEAEAGYEDVGQEDI